MTRKRSRASEHEPTATGSDWVEWGGQLIWAAGFTEGGAPYGLSEDELRASSEKIDWQAGWARSKQVMRVALERWAGAGARAEVGYVKKIGNGLSREIFAAEVEVSGASKHHVLDVAALLPHWEAGAGIDARTKNEFQLLRHLAQLPLPFRVPNVFGVVPEAGHLALVRSFERGIELDLRAGRQGRVRPWEVVGGVAAAVHKISAQQLGSPQLRYSNRREHAKSTLDQFERLSGPEANDARAWIMEHLPAPEPSVLVHGDLLGQNILLGLDDRDAVIDWEYAQFGDPAYDLAIVTRGVRRPFQIDRGLDRLLEAYEGAGGSEVKPCHVHIHELALAGHWYQEALKGHGPHAPEQQLQFLSGLLRRVTKN